MCQTFQQGFCIAYHLTYFSEYAKRERRVYYVEKGGGYDYCPHLSSWLCEVKDCDSLGHWYVTMLPWMRFGFNKYMTIPIWEGYLLKQEFEYYYVTQD